MNLYQCKECISDKVCGEMFVVKRIKKSILLRGNDLSKEFGIGKMLNHPSIIRTLDIDYASNSLIFEYFRSADLFHVLTDYKKQGKCTFTLVEYFKQLLGAVKYIHDNGVVHLDIKPANMLIDVIERKMKLIDFGSAQKTGEKTLRIKGTEAYIAPEALENKGVCERVSMSADTRLDLKKCDVWGCGIVLYNIVFVSMPWQIACASDKRYEEYKNGRVCGDEERMYLRRKWMKEADATTADVERVCMLMNRMLTSVEERDNINELIIETEKIHTECKN